MNHIIAGLASAIIAAASVPPGSIAPSALASSTAPSASPTSAAASSPAGLGPEPLVLTSYAAAVGATVGYTVPESQPDSVCTLYFVVRRPTVDSLPIGTPCTSSPPPTVPVTGSAPTTIVLTGMFKVPLQAVLGVPYKVYLVVCTVRCTTRSASFTNKYNRLLEAPFTVAPPSIHANSGPIRPSTKVFITGSGFTPPQVVGAGQGCMLTGELGSGKCTVAADGTVSGSLQAPAAKVDATYSVTATNTVALPPRVVIQAQVQVASTTVDVIPATQVSGTPSTKLSSNPAPSPDRSVRSSAGAATSPAPPTSAQPSTPGDHHRDHLVAWPLNTRGTTSLGVGLLLLAAALLAGLKWSRSHVGRLPDVQVLGAEGALPIPRRLGSRHPPMIALDLQLRHRRTTWFDPRREA